MSKIKNGGLDQYGTEAFEQPQFGTAGVEGVNKTCVLHEGNVCVYEVTILGNVLSFLSVTRTN